ncbi:NINE protein [Brachybacterium sp. DNPG3]
MSTTGDNGSWNDQQPEGADAQHSDAQQYGQQNPYGAVPQNPYGEQAPAVESAPSAQDPWAAPAPAAEAAQDPWAAPPAQEPAPAEQPPAEATLVDPVPAYGQPAASAGDPYGQSAPDPYGQSAPSAAPAASAADPYGQSAPSAADPYGQSQQAWSAAAPEAAQGAPASDPYGQPGVRQGVDQAAQQPYGQQSADQQAFSAASAGQAPYGQQSAGQAPYGQQPPAGQVPQAGVAGRQPQSRLLVGLLGIFLGGWGVHRFLLGYTKMGVIQIIVTVLTCGLGSLWGLVEGIMILAKSESFQRDAHGVPLVD